MIEHTLSLCQAWNWRITDIQMLGVSVCVCVYVVTGGHKSPAIPLTNFNLYLFHQLKC